MDISRARELSEQELLAEVKEDLEDEGIAFDRHLRVGTMIEVPSAALMAEQMAREVDFGHGHVAAQGIQPGAAAANQRIGIGGGGGGRASARCGQAGVAGLAGQAGCAVGIERMVISTYQSVSGAGQAGLDELAGQWTKWAGQEAVLRRAATTPEVLAPGEVWDRPIAGNVIPLAGSVKDAGYTSEEWKLVHESRKILHAPELRVSATCVRVPVYVGHAMTANVQFSGSLSRADAAALLAEAPGVVLVDGGDGAPTPLEGAGIDPVLVGRLREDPTQPDTLDLWVTGDNLRKGAALNGVQLAELLVR